MFRKTHQKVKLLKKKHKKFKKTGKTFLTRVYYTIYQKPE